MFTTHLCQALLETFGLKPNDGSDVVVHCSGLFLQMRKLR